MAAHDRIVPDFCNYTVARHVLHSSSTQTQNVKGMFQEQKVVTREEALSVFRDTKDHKTTVHAVSATYKKHPASMRADSYKVTRSERKSCCSERATAVGMIRNVFKSC